MKAAIVIALTFASLIGCAISQINNPYSSEGCGKVRTCFSKPPDCDGPTGSDACEMFASWWPSNDNESTHFALFGHSRGYIAVGISKSMGMPDTDVYACTSLNAVKRSYNIPNNKFNEPKTLIGVSDETVTFEDNIVKCQFRRQQSLENGDDTYFNLSGDHLYYSLIALGNNLGNDGTITIHDIDKQSSDKPVSFSSVDKVDTDVTAYKLTKAHAALMIIAWIGFAAPGITVARYFKPAWEKKTACGEKVWFAIHRFDMTTAFLLACAAFVLIFVAERDYVGPSEGTTRFLHAIFGTTIMGLAILNVIMAIFRPHPGTPRRIYYNIAHRSVGLLALTLSVITIFLGLNIKDPFLPNVSETAFWVLVGFVGFHLLTWLLFEVLPIMIKPKKAPESDDLPLEKETGSVNEDEIDQDPLYKRVLLNVYSLVVIFTSTWVATMVIISKQD